MKRALSITFVLALLVASFGPTPARADTNADFAAKLVGVMEQMAAIVDANKNNCDAMGDKLDKFVSDNADFLNEAKARAEKMTPDEKRRIEARYKARVEAVMAKLRDGRVRCGTNAKVVSALRKVQ